MYHDFHWLLVAAKLLTVKPHSLYIKESEIFPLDSANLNEIGQQPSLGHQYWKEHANDTRTLRAKSFRHKFYVQTLCVDWCSWPFRRLRTWTHLLDFADELFHVRLHAETYQLHCSGISSNLPLARRNQRRVAYWTDQNRCRRGLKK